MQVRGGDDFDLIIHSGSKSSEDKSLGHRKTVRSIDKRISYYRIRDAEQHRTYAWQRNFVIDKCYEESQTHKKRRDCVSPTA